MERLIASLTGRSGITCACATEWRYLVNRVCAGCCGRADAEANWIVSINITAIAKRTHTLVLVKSTMHTVTLSINSLHTLSHSLP